MVQGLKSYLRWNLNAKLQQAWCQAIENATKALNAIFRGFGRAQQILANAARPAYRFRDLDMFISRTWSFLIKVINIQYHITSIIFFQS